MKKKIALISLALMSLTLSSYWVIASDHDDGETDIKGRNLNLTDLYVFREDWQVSGGSSANLIFIMNSNPRSLPQQQYYFSTSALYDFHISRAGTDNSIAGTTNDNVILRFQFGAPNSSNVQSFTMTTIVDGSSTVQGSGTTTALGSSPTNNSVGPFTVFAGLRQDPFFFDVQGFFNFRSYLAGGGKNAGTALGKFTGADFTKGYNVNSIVVRVPISFLQANAETVFDTWETISIPE